MDPKSGSEVRIYIRTLDTDSGSRPDFTWRRYAVFDYSCSFYTNTIQVSVLSTGRLIQVTDAWATEVYLLAGDRTFNNADSETVSCAQ